MTEFGWACQEAKKETEMPAEYGGGTFEDGENKFNHETIKLEQMVPGKTYSYSYKGWPCYAERYATELSKAWSEEYANGAANGIEFYRSLYEKDPTSISVVPTFSYTFPDMSDAAKEKRALFAPVMKQGSWQCVYAESDEQFEQLWNDMVSTCKSYGYDDYVEEKMVSIQEALALALNQ